jgi:hypothetical protein
MQNEGEDSCERVNSNPLYLINEAPYSFERISCEYKNVTHINKNELIFSLKNRNVMWNILPESYSPHAFHFLSSCFVIMLLSFDFQGLGLHVVDSKIQLHLGKLSWSDYVSMSTFASGLFCWVIHDRKTDIPVSVNLLFRCLSSSCSSRSVVTFTSSKLSWEIQWKRLQEIVVNRKMAVILSSWEET